MRIGHIVINRVGEETVAEVISDDQGPTPGYGLLDFEPAFFDKMVGFDLGEDDVRPLDERSRGVSSKETEIGQLGRSEAPQPTALAVGSPAGLVGILLDTEQGDKLRDKKGDICRRN